MLYRVFPWVRDAEPTAPGGPLHVARALQGRNRHDDPRVYGVLYASRSPVGAVAEWLRRFVGRTLGEQHLTRPDGAAVSLAAISDAAIGPLPNLDDPGELSERGLRPSMVATHNRARTQRMARDIYDEGVDGFAWWSTVEATWNNVSLFGDRVAGRLSLAEPPHPLSVADAVVGDAAAALAIPQDYLLRK